MANPVLPADFHLGSYLGESLGQGTAKGLQAGMQQGYEGRVLKNAFEKLDPNASPMEKAQQFLQLPISKESKQMGLKVLEQELKRQPKPVGGGDIAKITDDLLKRYPGFADTFATDENMRAQHENMVRRSLANNPNQDPYTVSEKALLALRDAGRGAQQGQSQQQAPGQPGQPPKDKLLPSQKDHPSWFEQAPTHENVMASGDQGKKDFFRAIRQTGIASMFGANDPKKIEELTDKDPSFGRSVMMGLQDLFVQTPEMIAAIGLMGPAVGLSVLGLVQSAGKNIWEEASKEGKTTEADLNRIGQDIAKDWFKASVQAKLFVDNPMAKWVSKNLPIKDMLTKASVQEALKLVERGVVAPTVSAAVDKRLPSAKELAHSTAMGIVFGAGEGAGEISAARRGATEAKPAFSPQGAAQDVRAAQNTQNRLQQIQKAQEAGQGVIGQPKAQAGQASNVPPGSEARGDVSIPLSGPPGTKAGSPVPSGPKAIEIAQDVSKTIPEQQRAAIAQVQAVAGRVPQPQAQQGQLEPLQEAGRMAQMRGERTAEVGPREINARKQPETLMAEQAKHDQVQKMVGDLDGNLRQLRSLQKQRTTEKGEQRAATDKQIADLQNSIRDQQKSIRKLTKELETGRESVTDPAIADAITKMRQRVVKEAVEPPAVSGKQHAQRLVKEQKRVDNIAKAKKLKGKADNLPEGYSDSYTRIKEAYIKEYNDLIKNAEKQISSLKGDTSPEGIAERQVAERVREAAKRGLDTAEADLTNYRHSVGTKIADQQAKTVSLQKQRAKSEKKTSKVADKSVKDIERFAKEYNERPTKELTQKVADEVGVKPEVVTEATKQAEDAGKKAARRVIEMRRDRTKEPQERVEPPKTKGEKPKGEADLEAIKKEAESKASEKAKAEPKSDADVQEAKEKLSFQKSKKMAFELYDHIKKGQFKKMWYNPLGRQILIQAIGAGIEQIADAAFPGIKGIPKASTLGFALGGGLQRAPFARILWATATALRGIYNYADTQSNVKAYKEAVNARPVDPKRVMDAKAKLTPKQIKEAQASMRG